MEFFDTIGQVKTNWQPYKKWDLEQQKKANQDKELAKKYPSTPDELEHAKQYGRTIVGVINEMDQHSIDKSEDASLIIKNSLLGVELAGGAIGGTLATVLCKANPKLKSKTELPTFVIGILGTSIGASITSALGEVFGAQIEKQASRVARFQTRNIDLKDPRHFVIYDKEQMQQAEKLAATMPEVKEKRKDISIKKSMNPIKSMVMAKKTTDELSKDYDSYKTWKKDYLKEEYLKTEKFKNINLTPEELSKAEKSRDNILNVVKKIENSSLNYFMNMRLALCTMMIGVDAASLGLGFGIFKTIDTLQKRKILEQKSTGLNLTKMAALKALPIFVSISAIGPTVKLIKDAARIGRYKAKKEMLADPQNFIAYDSEQRKTVTDVKNPEPKDEGFFTKSKQDFAQIKQLKKDYTEYQNYMKTQHKEELKLQEALKQVKISDSQKTDAENLQKKAFHSFEKMDEKAQRYTDDTEAAVDTAKMLIMMVIGTIAKIFSFSFYGKKSKIYNNGKELKFTDMFKLLKYFKAKDILTVVGISIVPTLIHFPLIIKGIQIKKEAGKIGVMTAIKDLENPKNFLDEKNNEQPTQVQGK